MRPVFNRATRSVAIELVFSAPSGRPSNTVAMRILSSRPAVRWLAPLAFVVAISGTVLVATTATAERKLPPRTAEELLADVQQARVDGLSGTVIQRANLGIPEIPGAGGRDSSELSSLVSGTHTLRIRYSEPDKRRLAVLGTYGETDVIQNGTDLWIWSSRDQMAVHRTITPGSKTEIDRRPTELPRTPEEAARQALKALEPTTTVTTDSAVTVADREAYELVLDPNDDATLISQIRLAIDGDTRMPLRVQIFGAGDEPVFEVGYQEVTFTRPEDREFEFKPPPGTEVTEGERIGPHTPNKKAREQVRKEAQETRDQVKIVGSGWSTVAVGKAQGDAGASGSPELEGFLSQLEPVSGDWGSGRLLAGTAFSVVLTDDGRIAFGAVRPEKLYEALG
jgi:outer membrane lipoprotein-sorting protein